MIEKSRLRWQAEDHSRSRLLDVSKNNEHHWVTERSRSPVQLPCQQDGGDDSYSETEFEFVSDAEDSDWLPSDGSSSSAAGGSRASERPHRDNGRRQSLPKRKQSRRISEVPAGTASAKSKKAHNLLEGLRPLTASACDALETPVPQVSHQQDAGALLAPRQVQNIFCALELMFNHRPNVYQMGPSQRKDVDQDQVQSIGFRIPRVYKPGQSVVYEVKDKKAEEKRQEFARYISDLLHKEKPDFKWAAMGIHRRTKDHEYYSHLDTHNSDKHQSCIIGFSSEPDTMCELDLPKLGRKLNIKERFVEFDGKNVEHGPVKHMEGYRYSVVFYTPSNWHEHCDRLDCAVKNFLREKLGFQLPPP